MNIKNGFYSFIFVIFLLGKGLNATITRGPLNSLTEIGKQVKLECTADAPIAYWFLSKNGETSGELTIVGPGCSALNPAFVDHYTVELIDGGKTCNLNVSNITMKQAGVYRCQQGSADSSSAILTVLESSPVITVNSTTSLVENESVVIACTLNHNGSVIPAPTLRPYFYWTNSVGQNTSSSYDFTTNDTAVSHLRVIAGRQNITAYTCHVYLQLIPTAKPNYASNTPAVSSSKSSSAIEVLYGPSIPNITSGYQIITIDGIACEVSNVTCTSSGNPSPVYEWFDTLENVSLIKSSNFDLAEINRNYTCVASNTIRNEKLSSITFHVPKKGSTTKTCRFPHRESTWINVTGSDNGTGDCSKGYNGLNFTCNADTYPNASYQWTGADNSQVNSQIYKNITINGIYSCTAYFNQSTSNYTGIVRFANGTSEENVTECLSTSTKLSSPTTNLSGSPSVIIPAVVVPCWVFLNLIAMSVFLIYYNGRDPNGKYEHKKMLNFSFSWLKLMLPCLNESSDRGRSQCLWVFLFVLVSITLGLIVFPILLIKASCEFSANRADKLSNSTMPTSASNEMELRFSQLNDENDEDAARKNGQGMAPELFQTLEVRRDISPYKEWSNTIFPPSKTYQQENKETKQKNIPMSPNYAVVNKTKPRMDDDQKSKAGVPLPPINASQQSATSNPNAPLYGELNIALQSNPQRPAQLLTEETATQYASLKAT